MPLNVASLFVGVSANTSQAESQLNSFQSKMKSVASGLQSTGAGITTAIGAPVAAVGGSIIKFGADFEHSLSRVRKTTGLSLDDTKALGKGLLDLSATPTGGGNTAEQLAGIAEVAGQLGIEGTPAILDFTRVIAQFSAATGIAGEQAASQLNAIRQLTGLGPGQLENLSSTIVDLGNKTAATESQISEFGLRLSGALHTSGASAQEILGISATLASLQIDPEAGGTAISKFFVDMTAAANDTTAGVAGTSTKARELQDRLADLGASLNTAQEAQTQFGRNTPAAAVAANAAAIERYKREIQEAQSDISKLDTSQGNAAGSAEAMARVAGVTTEEFRNLVKTNPTAAFQKIIEGIGRIRDTEGAGAAFGAIESIGINDSRQRDAILRLASSAGQLQTNIDIANSAFESNTAAAVENAAAMEDTQKKFELLTNQIKRQIIEAWDILRPKVLEAMDAFRNNVLPRLEEARLAFANLSPEVQNFIIAAAAIAVVLGPALVVLGLMAAGLAAIASPIGLIVIGVGLLAAAWITNFGDIQGKTAAVFQFIRDNWQTLIGFIPLIGPALVLIVTHFDEIRAAVGRAISVFGTYYTFLLTVGERVFREVGSFFATYLQGPIASVGQWIGDHILGPLLELLKFIQSVIASTGIGGGIDINGAIRSGELALQGLSGGIAAGGSGQANSIVVNLNNPQVADQTVAERLAAEVTRQVTEAMISAERASSMPASPFLPGNIAPGGW